MPVKKRRRRGSGGIVQRKSGDRKGQHLARVMIRTIHGDSRRKTFAGRTRDEVQAKLQEAKDQGLLRTAAWSTRVLKDFAREWLASKKFQQYRPTTQASYGQDVAMRILPDLGTIRLGDLRAAYIAAWIVDMKGAGVGLAAAARAVRTLSSLLSAAVEAGLIAANPIKSLTHRQHVRYEAEGPETLNLVQLQKLFVVLPRYRFGPLLMLAATTGMRLGEILALKWESIDFDAGRLSVKAERVQLRKVFHDLQPKTAASKRQFALNKETLRVLRAHRKAMKEEDRAGEKERVFLTIRGTTPQRSNLLRTLHQACVLGKLPRISIRDLRASYTSTSRELGVPLEAVSRTLGHKQFTTTLRFYSRPFRGEHDRTAADAWEAALSGGNKVPAKVPEGKGRAKQRQAER